jgi:hypothetical protein
VFDIGCNRGMVGYQFASTARHWFTAATITRLGIQTAREWFADLRCVEARFEVVDLTAGTRGARRLQRIGL